MGAFADESYLEMPPRFLACFEASRDVAELVFGHLGQVVVIYDGTAACLLAADDVTACRLRTPLSI